MQLRGGSTKGACSNLKIKIKVNIKIKINLGCSGCLGHASPSLLLAGDSNLKVVNLALGPREPESLHAQSDCKAIMQYTIVCNNCCKAMMEYTIVCSNHAL